MTALALLFSVFRAQPSPFCILDEVDAALDDANIGRFLSLIEHSLGEDTQYVVVTHNKGTMAACQLLYGVTMAVKGVSRVVSVELDEVDEFVPEATGSGAARAPRRRETLEDALQEAEDETVVSEAARDTRDEDAVAPAAADSDDAEGRRGRLAGRRRRAR